MEHALHERFEHLRTTSEWFVADEELAAFNRGSVGFRRGPETTDGCLLGDVPLKRIVPALIALLVACAPAVQPMPEPVADAAPVARLAPLEPDVDQPLERPDCERIETVWIGPRRTVIALPCRPFDPRTDLGYPLP
jgi:hypothetical protein